jgi:ABC-type multidrug transport system fused ATPase/permease subunit
MNPLTYVIINLAIIFLIYVGALKVDTGDLTQGEVIALYNYMSQILVELVKLANLIISITKAMASASRISAMFDIQSERVYGECTDFSGDVAVEFESVSLSYNESSDPSLSDISFVARRGETVGIIGGTGAGKTTLVNMICRSYDASEGKVKLFSRDVSEYSKNTLTERVALAPQKAVLFSGTVRDNMLFAQRNATDEEIIKALEMAEAIGFVREKGGLEARVEAGGKNFSGGQRQRLTVARAVLKKSDVLILDDSSSALDYVTDANMRSSIRKGLSDTTVFIVSQRTASVMHADKIIVLDDGKAVGMGTHDELMAADGEYCKMFTLQASGYREEGADNE